MLVVFQNDSWKPWKEPARNVNKKERNQLSDAAQGMVCVWEVTRPLKRKVTAHTTRTRTGQKSMMSSDTTDSMVVFCALRPHVLDFPSAPEDWAED